MFVEELNAVPVVDENGHLVATLSASDMRGLTVNNSHNLQLKVCDYLDKMQSKRIISADLVVTGEETVEVALERMLKNKIHRLWVTRNGNELVGVISLTDILGMFSVSHP